MGFFRSDDDIRIIYLLRRELADIYIGLITKTMEDNVHNTQVSNMQNNLQLQIDNINTLETNYWEKSTFKSMPNYNQMKRYTDTDTYKSFVQMLEQKTAKTTQSGGKGTPKKGLTKKGTPKKEPTKKKTTQKKS